MRRDDVLLAGNAERGQGFGGMAHGVPVGLASHDDRDGDGHKVNSFRESKNIGRIIRSAQSTARRGKGTGMDYPVLVNRGKPLDLADLTQMPMKKKPRAPATRAGNRRKGGASGKSAPPGLPAADPH